MNRLNARVDMSGDQRAESERLVAAPTSQQRLVKRARIILLRTQRFTQFGTAAQVGVSRPAVIRWERPFAGLGLAGLEDAPGRGGKPSVSEAKKAKLIIQATPPPPNRTRGSVRSVAQQVGISPAGVQPIWAANEISRGRGDPQTDSPRPRSPSESRVATITQ